MYKYFKTKEKLKKIFNYFSIFTIVFGTTFGSINSSMAGDIAIDTTSSVPSSGTPLAFNFITTPGKTLTINTSETMNPVALAITDGVEGNVVITSAGDGDPVAATATADITSIVLDAASGATANSNLTITDADDATGTFTVTIDGAGTPGSGDVIIGGDLIVQSLEDTDDEDMSVTVTGTIQVDETAIISSAGAGDTTLAVGTAGASEGTTFTGGLTLTQSSTGLAILDINGNGTVAGAINATTAGDGKIVVDGVTVFSGILGAGGSIGTLDLNNTTTFGANVTAQTIEVIDAKVVTFKDDVVATSISLDATSNFTVGALSTAAATSITGAIDGLLPEEGIITVNNTDSSSGTAATTFVSTIGFTKSIEDINVDTDVTFNSTVRTKGGTVASGVTSTFKDNLTVGTDTFVITGTAAFTGTSAQTVSGELEGNTTGAITVSNSSGVTFQTEMGANAPLASLTTSGTGKATINLDGNAVNEVATGTGTTLEIAKTVLTTQTVFTTTSAQDLNSIHASSIILMPVNLKDGQYINLFDGGTTSTALNDDVDSALQNNALISYSTSTSTTSTRVTASAKTAATTSSELGVTNNQAVALKQAYLSSIDDTNQDGTAEDAMYNALQAQGGYSATEDTALARQVAPQDELISGSTFAAKATTGTVQGIMSSRMASLRSGDAYFGTGVNAAGEMMSANSAFIQIFGSEAEQDNLTKGSGIQYGYDTQTEGIAIGFDGINDNNSVFGISLSRSTTELVGKGTGSAKNDIDSYTVSLYMDKTTDAGYVEGSLTAGINENVTSRVVNTAGLSRTYKGAYDSSQLSLKIGGGVPKSVGGDAFVTPFGSVTGTLINTDDYTETSTTSGDNLRLRIAQDDVNSIVGTVGLKYHNVLSNGGVPMISLALNGELGDKTIDSTNTYQGGGTSFKTSTDVEELSATLGLGYTFNSDRTSVEIAYEADANSEDYLSHYGSFKIVGKF